MGQDLLVLVHVVAGGVKSIGYSYADKATAQLIEGTLAPKLIGHDALATGAAWRKMCEEIRNLGRPGIASMAIAAVDNSLWDLKGQLGASQHPGLRQRGIYIVFRFTTA
jgi:L-alanine-DL-glutamate epimerase-like enolase superfamily enzyme